MKKVFAFIKKHSMSLVATMTAFVTDMGSMLNVYADETLTAAPATEASLIKSVLEIIFKLFAYIGILLLAWSVGMLVLAFKNEDADSKSRAIMMMVVSVVLITIKFLIQPIIEASGVVDF